jgi:thioester reductase-like protein
MSTPQHIFLTGVTGMVGQEIFRWLMKNTDAHLWVLGHRIGREIPVTSSDLKRVRVLTGDIQLPDLGLSKEELGDVRSRATDFIHAAGTTNFGALIENARGLNVEGTKNVFYLAESCKNLVRFGFVSTAYVAGRRTGTVREQALRHDAGFVNRYEQSKYEAELWLAEIKHRLPCATYRLSTLLGESATGYTSRFIAPHHLVRFVYLGLISMLPGRRENTVDLLSTDHALNTLCELHFKNFQPATYHITAGFEHSLTIGELIDTTYESFAKHDEAWAQKKVERPLLVDKQAFDLFLRSVEETRNPLFLQVIANTKFFADQLFFPKNFDSAQVIKSIPGYYKDMPSIRETYKKMILFCLRTNWGRQMSQKHD